MKIQPCVHAGENTQLDAQMDSGTACKNQSFVHAEAAHGQIGIEMHSEA